MFGQFSGRLPASSGGPAFSTIGCCPVRTHGSRYMIRAALPSLSADRSPAHGPASSTTTDAPRVVSLQAARLPQEANTDFDLRQLLGVTAPSWNDAAPADLHSASPHTTIHFRGVPPWPHPPLS